MELGRMPLIWFTLVVSRPERRVGTRTGQTILSFRALNWLATGRTKGRRQTGGDPKNDRDSQRQLGTQIVFPISN
jgi:hypothetical protein